MRYAILGDVHANLEALSAVIKQCKNEGARRFFCVGDIVGYGANPSEAIAKFIEVGIVSVAGNHDWAVAGKISTENLNETAAKAAVWTQKKVRPTDVEYLNALALIFKNDDFLMVHGSLNHPQQFHYLTDIEEAADTFYLMDRRVCFVGHTHVPRIFVRHGERSLLTDTYKPLELRPDFKYIVNVGSVGQPRDGNPHACYCIYDPDLERIEIKRVAYHIHAAQTKIMQAGLPESLGSRLVIGQ